MLLTSTACSTATWHSYEDKKSMSSLPPLASVDMLDMLSWNLGHLGELRVWYMTAAPPCAIYSSLCSTCTYRRHLLQVDRVKGEIAFQCLCAQPFLILVSLQKSTRSQKDYSVMILDELWLLAMVEWLLTWKHCCEYAVGTVQGCTINLFLFLFLLISNQRQSCGQISQNVWILVTVLQYGVQPHLQVVHRNSSQKLNSVAQLCGTSESNNVSW